MTDSSSNDFLVRRNDLSEVRWAPATTRADLLLGEGETLLKVDRYALTANNITYALAGELARYWDFFPAEAGWGRIPVWGHADVIASRAACLPEGQRIFGYLPMSPLLKVQARQVSERAFVDESEHRRPLPPVYQVYTRTKREVQPREDVRALVQPLALTGWLLDDWLLDNELFGARQILFGSASSKTALCAAFMLRRHAQRSFEVVGLTSARHRGFCERTGFYDRVVQYEDVGALDPRTPAVLVDMSGSASVVGAVHEHFQGALRHSCAVGLSHGKLRAPTPLPGPARQFFMAPAYVQKRQQELGAQVFEAAPREALAACLAAVPSWLQPVSLRGASEIEAAYRRLLAGEVEPHEGLMLSP